MFDGSSTDWPTPLTPEYHWDGPHIIFPKWDNNPEESCTIPENEEEKNTCIAGLWHDSGSYTRFKLGLTSMEIFSRAFCLRTLAINHNQADRSR